MRSVKCKTASTFEMWENLTAVIISLIDLPVGSKDEVGSLAAMDANKSNAGFGNRRTTFGGSNDNNFIAPPVAAPMATTFEATPVTQTQVVGSPPQPCP
jgi:hypothetical protein